MCRWMLWLFIGIALGGAGTSAQAIGPAQQGLATFYGGPQDNTSPNVASYGLVNGACGYGALQQSQWPYWQAVAVGPGNIVYTSGNLKGCGACIQATCTAGCPSGATPLVVLVTDTCDDCTSTQLNIAAFAFEQHFVSDLSVGQVNVQWQQVDCNPPGQIIAEVVSARESDGGFLAMALLEVGGSGVIKNLEFMDSSQSFVPMTNSYGAVWQVSKFGSPPFALRITGDTGQILTTEPVIPQVALGQYPTNVQFAGFGGSGNASAPPAALTPPPAVSPLPVGSLPTSVTPPAISPNKPSIAMPPPPFPPPFVPPATPLHSSPAPAPTREPPLPPPTPPPKPPLAMQPTPMPAASYPPSPTPLPIPPPAHAPSPAPPSVMPTPIIAAPQTVTPAPAPLLARSPPSLPLNSPAIAPAAAVPSSAPARSPASLSPKLSASVPDAAVASAVVPMAPAAQPKAPVAIITAPVMAPSVGHPAPAQAPAALSPTSVAPAALAPAPSFNASAANASPGANSSSSAAATPAAAPGTTQLSLNSSLSGDAATAASSILRPTINIAGRRL